MELEIVRRDRKSLGQYLEYKDPMLKLELPRGQIIVFEKSMQLMGFAEKEAVMFGFNKREKCGYIFKEEPQDDSYYLSMTNRNCSRFTSKNLMMHMIEVFGITNETTVYFKIDSTPNKKNMWRFIKIENPQVSHTHG